MNAAYQGRGIYIGSLGESSSAMVLPRSAAYWAAPLAVPKSGVRPGNDWLLESDCAQGRRVIVSLGCHLFPPGIWKALASMRYPLRCSRWVGIVFSRLRLSR